ncbi:fam-a protein [Plasmodium vinckei vinckei]|uniref:Fam-a protein n=1 Tax=Plasmodium vinckei vinckei TaxID=54757 RepID=A0A449BM78_PLAVN|nr:fam-a protein [Plasmodium vinckei vinckei]VEV54532.1 fam-a protein [Plasmodium vinckei vinckei]
MNKFYIQFVFFLLTILIYVNNKTLASEPAPRTSTTSESTYQCLTLEEIYEKNKHLLCSNPEEAIKAGEVINEAVEALEYHAANIDDYEVYERDSNSILLLFKKKKYGDLDIKKTHYVANTSYEYNEIINMAWDPDYAIFLNISSFKIVRVYNPTLVIIQQRYKDNSKNRQKYFYALAAYVEMSKDRTIVVRVSADINDHNPSNDKYKNEIVKNANLFKIDIDAEDDIRKGELEKTFVNIAGYIVEKKGNIIEITYIESINKYCTI